MEPNDGKAGAGSRRWLAPLSTRALLCGLAAGATYAAAVATGHSHDTIFTVASWILPGLLFAALLSFAERWTRARARRRRLGPYELEQRIGRGGMGEVWQARHRMLARRAAIKLIRERDGAHDAASRHAMRVRFDREAQVTATLSSPHTVGLYDFGRSERGSLYYVMELLDGTDLEQLVREHGPVSPERAVHLLRQVCHSLAEAHDHDLVHRDIKPSNVRVCTQGLERDFVKVLDFGLVGVRPGARQEAAGISGAATLMGSLGYLAPEVLAGAPFDVRSDLYAVGCVAYWLLTGQRVFELDDPTAVAMAHLRAVPSAPSVYAEQPVPAALDALVLSCLERDPSRRPASARDLLAALDACELPRVWTSKDAERWWRLHCGPSATSKGLPVIEAHAA
jgi:eukaryotic-like serine/threonine-protein kinase